MQLLYLNLNANLNPLSNLNVNLTLNLLSKKGKLRNSSLPSTPPAQQGGWMQLPDLNLNENLNPHCNFKANLNLIPLQNPKCEFQFDPPQQKCDSSYSSFLSILPAQDRGQMQLLDSNLSTNLNPLINFNPNPLSKKSNSSKSSLPSSLLTLDEGWMHLLDLNLNANLYLSSLSHLNQNLNPLTKPGYPG